MGYKFIHFVTRQRLSAEEAINYVKLRDALLRRYQLTEEGSRQKFRISSQEVGETAGQFAIRLKNYLARWMELGNVPETFEGLRDLFLREQFLTVSNKNLVLFLKERKIKTIEEMTEIADQYMEAHTISESMYHSHIPLKNEGKGETIRKPLPSIQTQDARGQLREFKERYCYGCGKKDHFIRNCPLKPSGKPTMNTKAAGLQIQIEKESSIEEITNAVPKKDDISVEDTMVATCIVYSVIDNYVSTAQSSLETGAQVMYNKSNPVSSVIHQNRDTYRSGHRDKMPVQEGYVDSVRILRDSGCNSVIIRENLVQKEQLT